MRKKILLSLLLVLFNLLSKIYAQDTLSFKDPGLHKFMKKSVGGLPDTTLSGIIWDKSNKAILPFVNIYLEDENKKPIASTQTDLGGRFNFTFKFDSVSTLYFTLKLGYSGYRTLVITGIPKERNYFELELRDDGSVPNPANGVIISETDIFSKPFNGEGYMQVYREDKKISKEGVFHKYRLTEGRYYIYDENEVLQRIALYKDGKYIADKPTIK